MYYYAKNENKNFKRDLRQFGSFAKTHLYIFNFNVFYV